MAGLGDAAVLAAAGLGEAAFFATPAFAPDFGLCLIHIPEPTRPY